MLEKSRKLLVQVMGEENFNKFIENGKIEIKHEIKGKEIIYELDQDARVYNRTTNQSYCITPICPVNLPLHDQLAIKYTYLKNNIKRVEEVANKTNLAVPNIPHIPHIQPYPYQPYGGGRLAGTNDVEIGGFRYRPAGTSCAAELELSTRRPDYSNYVSYMEDLEWRRHQITLDEKNTRLVTTSNLPPNSTGCVIDVRCPAGQKISIMGTQQVPAGCGARAAHALRVRLANREDVEIPLTTRTEILKDKPVEDTITLDRCFYADINLIRSAARDVKTDAQDGTRIVYKTDSEWYRFLHGVELNGEEHLQVFVENCELEIDAENTRLALDCDLWVN